MISEFHHFIITRYNVKLDGWEKDIKGNSTQGRSWGNHRFELFVRYCMPSLVHQTDDNFHWLIYIDHETDCDLVSQLQNVLRPYPSFEIRKVSGYHDCMHDIDKTLTNTQSKYVITTRLDNDDGLGVEYIRMVHAHFKPEDKLLLNFLHGHGYDMNQQIFTRIINMHKNHFSSLIEQRRNEGGHLSVRGFPHDNPPNDLRIQNIDWDNSWLKVFHDRNLKSILFGYPLFFSDAYNSYGVKSNDLAINRIQTLLYSFPWLINGLKRKMKAVFKDF